MYFRLAVLFVFLGAGSISLLAVLLKSFLAISLFLIIIFLSWSYSEKPLQFSYRRTGELIIFLLFGPVPVMGGYFIQTGIFPDLRSFLLALPFGFFTTAILFANEVPDYREDKKAGKFTWVSLTGIDKAFLLYLVLILLGLLSIILAVALGFLSFWAYVAFVALVPALKAVDILRQYPDNKLKLMQSSQLTIATQTIVSIILILSVFI